MTDGIDGSAWSIRSATNMDRDGIIALIDSVLGEWDDAVCLEDSESDLLNIQASYADQGGVFIVLADEQSIAGTHAVLPVDRVNGVCTFKRLYLRPDLRGTQAGRALMQWTIDWAADQGFSKIEFWSDSRFKRAHHFFSKFGFERDGRKREMHDSHEVYWEYYFSREIL